MIRHHFGLDAAHTQTTTVERKCIQKYVVEAKTAVELGVYEGVTTTLIRESMKTDGVLYAVDPFFPGRVGVCWGKMVAKTEIARGRGATVVFVEKLSTEAASEVPIQIDFIFIDADHSYDGIRKDWELWAGRVREGGMALLHDTRIPAHNPDVARLGSFRYFEEVIRFDKRYELLEQVDSLSVLRRTYSESH